MYDLIIIGAGPAGITAGIYAARKKINFLLISKDIGGQAVYSNDIENYTGYQFITGIELIKKFEEHMKTYKININENEEVTEIRNNNDIIIITTNKNTYQAKSVVIASGKKPKELGVPGENEFKNKGVAYCATCDAPLFSNKSVAVVGGGNSALDAALQLINISNHVYLINNTSNLGGDEIMRDKVISSPKITVMNNTNITEIMGDKFVNKINIMREASPEIINVEGIFIEIGLIPNSDCIKDIEKNKLGEIIIDCNNRTSIPGIFAAGDVTSIQNKQVIIAAGEGAKASLSAIRYLNQTK